MAKGDRITSASYNNNQVAVANILGLGSGTSGYGQGVASSTVIPNSLISAAQWNNLRTDMAKCYGHQTNTSVVSTVPVNDGVVDVSSTRQPPNLYLIPQNTIISSGILAQYNNMRSSVVTNRESHLQMLPGQEPTSVPRSGDWNGTITHTITYTFGSYTSGSLSVSASNHIRCFFNAGGSISISALRTGGLGTSKDVTWSTMLSTGLGTYTFRAGQVDGGAASGATGTNQNGGSVSALGYRQLTVGSTLNAVVVNGPGGTNYTENIFRLNVTLLSNGGLNNQLQFTLIFEDNDTGDQTGLGPAVDENVTGTITPQSSVTRPFGANVDVPAPTGTATW